MFCSDPRSPLSLNASFGLSSLVDALESSPLSANVSLVDAEFNNGPEPNRPVGTKLVVEVDMFSFNDHRGYQRARGVDIFVPISAVKAGDRSKTAAGGRRW